jgi:metallopeptidase MepB
MLPAKAATEFLERLQKEIAPYGEVERKEMLNFKREYLLSQTCEQSELDENLYFWDTAYHSRLMKENQVQFDETELSEYFALDEVVRGFLKTFETLFGLEFEKVEGEQRRLLMEKQGQPTEAATWHESIVMFSVWNEEAMGGEFLGYLYLDLLQRDGKKDHPCNIALAAVSSPLTPTYRYNMLTITRDSSTWMAPSTTRAPCS